MSLKLYGYGVGGEEEDDDGGGGGVVGIFKKRGEKDKRVKIFYGRSGGDKPTNWGYGLFLATYSGYFLDRSI